jgi:succinate dehydrogenase hydrophobic anchor subunit
MATQVDRTAPSAPAPSWGWFLQAITGLALVVLLAVHMVAQHFVAAHGLRDYAEVVAYLRNPLVTAIELLFLVTVTTHALLGVRAIVFDFGSSVSVRAFLEWSRGIFREEPHLLRRVTKS